MQVPGAMLRLIVEVQLLIIGLLGHPHLPQYLQPSLAETPQRGRMALAFLAFLAVIDLGPVALGST